MVLRILVLALGLSLCAKAAATPNDDQYCLALTAFTEARDEGQYGMQLVVHTVLNRAAEAGKSACQIAHQPNQYYGVLHWRRGNPAKTHDRRWNAAVRAVTSVLADKVNFAACEGATHFYAPALVRVTPKWARKLEFRCEYNGHRFYSQ